MQKTRLIAATLFYALTNVCDVLGQDPLMVLLDKELQRIQEVYGRMKEPPYFMDMRIHDIRSSVVQFSSGILTTQQQSHDRFITSGVRIGNYMKDNTSLPEDMNMIDNRIPVFSGKLPFEDDSLAICRSIDWSFETAYEQSLQQYRLSRKSEDRSGSKATLSAFSVEKPSVYYEEPSPPQLDEKAFTDWREVLRNVSEIQCNDTSIVSCGLTFMVMDERIYYLSTEGSRVVQNRPQCQIQIIIAVKTRDGTIAPLTRSYIGRNLAALPTAEKLEDEVLSLRALLTGLINAPLADPYAGPAILSPEAAGVFFHEIFGHRIEGQRLNNAYDSHTFMDKVGKQIINHDITVIADPTQTNYNGTPLFGSYSYDDEGIPAQAVTIVEKGILKNFLMARIPIKGHLHSNGHGRSQMGSAPFSRQSNLFIKSSASLTEPALRKLLVKECRKQGKSYGYYIKEVYGGFTSTDLFSPQVFNIMPTIVYRIYTDGRPDELVRGVSFIGTPLTVFSGIMAAGDSYKVFNGFCGAESGSIPVSTISPGLLINKLETQKMPENKVALPGIPSPRPGVE